jgi:hypothetical protein
MHFATRSSVAALAAWVILGAAAASVSASPIETPIHYSTYGSVDSFGVNGQPIVVYEGVQYGSLTTGSTFNIGKFSVASTSEGGSATYTDIPFQIALRVQSLDGSAPSPNQTPAILQGTLSAVITDGKIDSLTAKFPTFPSSSDDPPPYPSSIAPFQIGGYNGFLNVTSSGDGGSPIQANLNVAPVPEPTSMLVFAAAAGLVALRARRRPRP